LQIDDRLGGLQRWRMEVGEKWKMQIPAEIGQCIAFVGLKTTSGHYEWAGTCFFVSVPCEERKTRRALYAVTTRHSIEEAKKRFATELFIRINLKSGTAIEIATSLDSWVVHETDQSRDIAIFDLDWKPEFDHLAYPVESFISAEVIKDEEIGPGESLFLAGLFTQVPGESINIPILRVGTLAAMPEERVHVRNWPPLHCYLAEMRSYGGLSGSPVFVNLGETRTTKHPEYGFITGSSPFRFYLMGMIHGHYESEKENQGIAIVVRAKEIAESLKDPRLLEHRRRFLTLLPHVTSTTDIVTYSSWYDDRLGRGWTELTPP
jgi:hypothetical protein